MMAYGPKYVDYYNSIDDSEVSKARQFIVQWLRGDIVNEQSKYIAEPFAGHNMYDICSNAYYNSKYSVTIEADVKVRYDDINRIAIEIERLCDNRRDLEKMQAINKSDNESLSKLLESNAACKQAWDKFILLAQLADGNPQLVEKLQNRKLL